jgi:hypothetical protein
LPETTALFVAADPFFNSRPQDSFACGSRTILLIPPPEQLRCSRVFGRADECGSIGLASMNVTYSTTR